MLVAAYFLGGSKGDDGDAAAGAGQAMPTPAAAQVTQAAATSQAADAFTVMRGQQPTERQVVDEARMTVLEGGRVLRIEGGVGRNFARQLESLLAENRALQRIDITSGGGYTMIGFQAARLINRNNLTVRVKSHCASICVALWAAAFSRQLETGAVIGLHQWTAQCEVMPSPERERCRNEAQFATDNTIVYEAWLRSAGFSPALIALQARTPPQDMAILGAAQLRSHGVDLVIVDKAG